MATFTWTATAPGGAPTAWATPAAWFDNADSVNPTSAAFTASPGNDWIVGSSNNFTINNIGAGGTSAPDTAHSLTFTDVAATLALADGGGALDVSATLTVDGLLNLGTAVGGGVLSLGGTAGGGTIILGASGRLEGALNDSIRNIGTSPTEILGSGTIIAEGGIFQIGTSVEVASTGASGLKFQIDPNATLAFADAVGGGTITFSTAAGSGTGVLDVAALSTFGASVKGLFVGQTVDVATSYIDFLNVGTHATATITNFTSLGATLTVFTSTGSQAIPILGNYLGKNANVNYVSDGNGGTNVFLTDAPCYAAGTAILTPDGEVPVETIQPGDSVMTSDAGRLASRTVLWTGTRDIDLTRHPKRRTVAPVRFRRGALGHDLPRRDLLLSPDHCLFLDGGLIPAKLLINGMTIVRDDEARAVSYHHIELDQHAVLIAEGVEAESYLDTGNRAYFSNAGLATVLHPEFGINRHLRRWETDACAPLMTWPEAVKPVWDRYAARAEALGLVPPSVATTTDPDIRLVVDGRVMRPVTVTERTVVFPLPEGAGSVRLLSRSAAPCEFHPWRDDPRVLGVAVRRFMLRDRTGETVLDADHPALTDGWHAVEHSAEGAPWRWSGGDAALPIASDGPCLLEITLGGAAVYAGDGDRLAA